jgi:hypothetical protein
MLKDTFAVGIKVERILPVNLLGLKTHTYSAYLKSRIIAATSQGHQKIQKQL